MELFRIVFDHYKSSAIREWYKVLGAADIIGSPASVFKKLKAKIQGGE